MTLKSHNIPSPGRAGPASGSPSFSEMGIKLEIQGPKQLCCFFTVISYF